MVDGHNHDAISAADNEIDVSGLEVLRSNGIDAVIVALPFDRSETSDLANRIRGEVRQLRRLAADRHDFSIADDPEAVLTRSEADGIRILFSIEWFGSIFGGDPSRIEWYRDLGVRIISLTEQDPDGLFGEGKLSSTLTPHGSRVLNVMNEVGVLIDITHLDHRQKLEVIRQSSSPVVATHMLAGEVNPTSFNLPPDVVTALAEHGGSVWVSFNKSDLLGGGPDEGAIDLLVDHIEVLVEQLGADHVGIGSDLQAAGRYVPPSLNRSDAFTEIGRQLIRRGHTQETVNGVLGRNVLLALAGNPGGIVEK